MINQPDRFAYDLVFAQSTSGKKTIEAGKVLHQCGHCLLHRHISSWMSW